MVSHCVICNSARKEGLTEWHFVCEACQYENSTLQPSINQTDAHNMLDEAHRADGLKALRQDNFREIVNKIAPGTAPTVQRSLLDVGCAHGWFLEEASKTFTVSGIEPDRHIAAEAAAKGFKVHNGLFPDCLPKQDKYDVITFNDVFEHLPSVRDAFAACAHHLNDNGLLVLNIPSSHGIFYRLSKVLFSLGIEGPFRRMWQEGLPSPHLHYFNPDNLDLLAREAGFRRVESFSLKSVKLRGLWSRLRFVRDSSVVFSLVQWLGVALLVPLQLVLPKDIHVSVFQLPRKAA